MRLKSLPFLALLLVAGCGGGSSGGSSSTPKGETLVLTAQGGRSATADGSVVLDHPAGGVPKKARTIAMKPTGLPDSSRVVGTGIVLSTVKLAVSGTLTLAYAPGALPSGTIESDLAIYRLDGKAWTLIGGKVDAIAHTLTAPITELGTFAVLTPETASLVAEAALVDGSAGVRVTWKPDGFSAPEGTRSRWQVYRSDAGGVPVLQAAADATSVQENPYSSPRTFDDYLLAAGTGLSSLGSASLGNTPFTYTPSLKPGIPVRYSAQLVYSVPTKTTVGYTVGGVTVPYTPPALLYFLSGKSVSGQATPLAAPVLFFPRDYAPGTKIDFQFQAVGKSGTPLEYVVEVFASDDPASILRTAPFNVDGNDPVTRTIDLSNGPSALLTTTNGVFWRVGVRNPTDVPGPVPDSRTGLRYVYSSTGTVRPVGPPGPIGG